MIRDNYNVIKVEIQAGATYYGSFHELRIWFEGMNLDSPGCVEKVPIYKLKDKGIIKRGYSFKKSQAFYDSEEGINWLGKYLKERDYKNEQEDLIRKLRIKAVKLSIEQLNKLIQQVDEMKNV